jgi:formylmethanofuran dehydrogenase subunit B
MRSRGSAPATINGAAVDVESALTRAAQLLRGARRPLLHGFDGATVEDVRAAVALADRLGALISIGSPAEAWPGAPAIPLRGSSTATLGEIRDRSQVVVIWREDPETTHPRLLERLGLGERSERMLVVVDDRDTPTARRAEWRMAWSVERDLMERLGSVPHAAFVYGPGLTGGAGGQRRALALHELVRALCHERHVVTFELSRAPGTRSADDVLAWQTGYGGAVDFAGGHPELVTATKPLIAGEGVDVSLRIEAAPAELPADVTEIALGSLPYAVDVEVSIRTAAAGVSAGGTAHRLDGVPLTLQAPETDDAPTAALLLTRLLAEIET